MAGPRLYEVYGQREGQSSSSSCADSLRNNVLVSEPIVLAVYPVEQRGAH